MSFWDHLEELRGTVFRSVLAIIVLSIPGIAMKNILFDGIVLAPTRPEFFIYRWTGIDMSVDLINIEVTAQFFVHLKLSIALGLVLSFPFIIWEIWKFVSPALYENEKRSVKKAFSLASMLFYAGVMVGYCIVLPVCLNFFMGYTVSDAVQNTISLNSYISLFISMVILIGIVFEFPTVILALSSMGILGRSTLRKYRKHAFLSILVVAAFITPSDPVSMFVLSVPLYLLYEGSILLCKEKKEIIED